MSKEAPSKQLNRREVLIWLGARSGEVAAVGISVPIFTSIRNAPSDASPQEANYQTTPPKENNGVLKVKNFSSDIIYVSNELFNYDSDESVSELLVGFFAGNVVLGSLSMQNRILDKKISSLSAFPAREIDSLSTMVFATQMQDKRFKEYGFDDYLKERNMVIPSNPTIEDVIKANLITLPVLIAASWAAPAIGRGYLGMSPFVAKHNLTFAAVIAKSLSLGDSVKDLINKGEGAEQIAQFLGATLAKAQAKPQKP